MSKRRRRLLTILLAADLATIIATRLLGYRLGPNTIVRCRQGHLFTTTWIPFASIKSLRFGFYRFQRCPIGPHWTLVHPVKEANLTKEERQFAAAHRDTKIP